MPATTKCRAGFLRRFGSGPVRGACGTHHIRDENSALNGLQQVVKELEVPGSGRLGDKIVVRTRRAWRFDGLGIAEMPGIVGGRVGDHAAGRQEIK